MCQALRQQTNAGMFTMKIHNIICDKCHREMNKRDIVSKEKTVEIKYDCLNCQNNITLVLLRNRV